MIPLASDTNSASTSIPLSPFCTGPPSLAVSCFMLQDRSLHRSVWKYPSPEFSCVSFPLSLADTMLVSSHSTPTLSSATHPSSLAAHLPSFASPLSTSFAGQRSTFFYV